MRDIHNTPQNYGNVSGNQYISTAFNPNDTPQITMRDIHNTPQNYGNLSGNQYISTAFNPNDTPQTTMRDIHNTNISAGSGPQSSITNTASRLSVPNINLNNNRQGTTTYDHAVPANYNEGPNLLIPHTQLNTNKSTPINYVNGPSLENPSNNNLPFNTTYTKQPVIVNTRIQDYHKQVLATNPFINNTQDKASY